MDLDVKITQLFLKDLTLLQSQIPQIHIVNTSMTIESKGPNFKLSIFEFKRINSLAFYTC